MAIAPTENPPTTYYQADPTALDTMAADYLQTACTAQNNGNRNAALAAAQSALIALVSADAIENGRGMAL